jgi:hypothetical protein
MNAEINTMPSLADELNKLQRLRQDGVLTEAEFAQAKAQVLAGLASTQANASANAQASASDQHWQEQRYHNELARIDREWELEQKEHMLHTRVGPQTPKNNDGEVPKWVFTGFGTIIALVGFLGLISMIFTPNYSRSNVILIYFIPIIFGGLVIWSGWAISKYHKAKADAYQAAYQRYQQRRSEVIRP